MNYIKFPLPFGQEFSFPNSPGNYNKDLNSDVYRLKVRVKVYENGEVSFNIEGKFRGNSYKK